MRFNKRRGSQPAGDVWSRGGETVVPIFAVSHSILPVGLMQRDARYMKHGLFSNNKQRKRGNTARRCNAAERHDRTVYSKNRTKIQKEREAASAPQSHGVVKAAACQKRRRRVKRNRENKTAVPLQSRHTSRRRVVGGQQPQSHGLVFAAGCQKRRRRVRGNLLAPWACPGGNRYVSHQRRHMNTAMHNFYVLEMKRKLIV